MCIQLFVNCIIDCHCHWSTNHVMTISLLNMETSCCIPTPFCVLLQLSYKLPLNCFSSVSTIPCLFISWWYFCTQYNFVPDVWYLFSSVNYPILEELFVITLWMLNPRLDISCILTHSFTTYVEIVITLCLCFHYFFILETASYALLETLRPHLPQYGYKSTPT